MTDEEKLELFNNGFIEGKKHPVPSPLTNKMIKTMDEKINKIETDIAITKKDISYLKEAHKADAKRNINEHGEIKNVLEKYLEEVKNNCADKIVEKVVYGLVGMILIAFFGGVIALIIG